MASATEYENSVNRLCHEYFASWKVEKLEKLGSNSLKTPAFSPFPDSDATFFCELWYSYETDDDYYNYDDVSSLKVVLVKSSGLNIPQSMKMNIGVTLNYLSGSTLLIDNPQFKYQYYDVVLQEMDTINVANEILRSYNYDSSTKCHKQTDHKHYGTPSCSFVLKCHFAFYNHLNSPSEYFQNARSLKNLKNFANDFKSIFQPSLLSDIEFKIGNESLPAHKSILSAHSPVFQRMMCDSFLESKTNTIAINDSSPEIFNSFLKYLYSGEIEDKTWTAVKELFALADKYDVGTLKSECGAIAATLISVENACEMLKMAYDYAEDHLKQEAKKFAYKYIGELLSKEEWAELMKSNPLIGYEVMLNFATPKFPPE